MPEGSVPLGERIAGLEASFKAECEKGNNRHLDNTKRLDAILQQTTTTNGRVTLLEGWLHRVKGAWWLMLVLAGLIGFLLERVVFRK